MQLFADAMNCIGERGGELQRRFASGEYNMARWECGYLVHNRLLRIFAVRIVVSVTKRAAGVPAQRPSPCKE